MKSIRPALFVTALALISSTVGSVYAQDAPGRKEMRRVDLSGAPGMEVVLSISEYKPGDSLPAHLHYGI